MRKSETNETTEEATTQKTTTTTATRVQEVIEANAEAAKLMKKHVEELETQLKQERMQKDNLKLQFDELRISLESADVNYEMLKQNCMAQFQLFQEEIQVLKMMHSQQNSNTINNSGDRRSSPQTSQSRQQENNQLRSLASSVEENNEMISDLDLRFQIHENTKFNGRLLWKIDEYHTRRQETLSEEINALHSAPCFTSEYGYKFCLRAYLDGDGLGRNTHLSVFIVLMKTDHDSILEWPFQKKVKFTLINQQNRKLDVTEKMVASKDSQSFQRPKNEMNVASGCPLFISLDRLDAEGFLKEDALFFDVTVE